MVANIGPSRLNLLWGVSALVMAALPALILGTGIYYEGLSSIWDWPPIYNWISGIFVVLVSLGIYALFTPQMTGAEIRFDGDQITLRIKPLCQREKWYDLRWSELDKVVSVEGPSYSDALGLEMRSGAKVTLPISLIETSASETVARFQEAAEATGYTLKRDRGFDVLIVSKKIWTVRPAE